MYFFKLWIIGKVITPINGGILFHTLMELFKFVRKKHLWVQWRLIIPSEEDEPDRSSSKHPECRGSVDVVHGRVHPRHKERRVHEGPSAATAQWDQALIWLSRLPPGGPEPRVSSKIAQVPFPQRRRTVTLADGLFGCNTVINADGASSFHGVQALINTSLSY